MIGFRIFDMVTLFYGHFWAAFLRLPVGRWGGGVVQIEIFPEALRDNFDLLPPPPGHDLLGAPRNIEMIDKNVGSKNAEQGKMLMWIFNSRVIHF